MNRISRISLTLQVLTHLSILLLYKWDPIINTMFTSDLKSPLMFKYLRKFPHGAHGHIVEWCFLQLYVQVLKEKPTQINATVKMRDWTIRKSMGKKNLFIKCHLQHKSLDEMVACEVTEILTQRSSEEVSFVWGIEWPHKPN